MYSRVKFPRLKSQYDHRSIQPFNLLSRAERGCALLSWWGRRPPITSPVPASWFALQVLLSAVALGGLLSPLSLRVPGQSVEHPKVYSLGETISFPKGLPWRNLPSFKRLEGLHRSTTLSRKLLGSRWGRAVPSSTVRRAGDRGPGASALWGEEQGDSRPQCGAVQW